MVAGVQEPVTPFGEVVAKIGATEPVQKSAIGVKSGLRFGTTFTAKVCVVAHCPALGVNTYEPEFTLSMVAGDQEPVIPLGEVVANIGTIEPAQKSEIAVKSGVVVGITVIVPESDAVAHEFPVVVMLYSKITDVELGMPDIVKVLPVTMAVTPVGKPVTLAPVAPSAKV